MVSGVSLNQVNPYQVNRPKKENKNIGNKIGAVIAGGAVYKITPTIVHTPVALELACKMQKINNSLLPEEAETVLQAVKKAINLSGLKDKGVEIIKASEENSSLVEDLLRKNMSSGFLGKYVNKKRLEKEVENTKDSLIKGTNAYYLSDSNKIIMSDGNKLALAGFHEAGHAMNANLGKATKLLQKSRHLSFLTLPILAIALLKKPKAEGEKPQGAWDKATTFIQNHAGILTASTFLPTIAEEGLATFRGNKLAKKLLSPELAKKVAKTNLCGFASYVALAAAFGTAVHLAVKVKNAIAHPELNKDKVQNC